MSYGFDMNFKHCRSLGDALLLANKAANITFQHLSEQIEDNRCWIPALQYRMSQADERTKRTADDLWLERLLKMSFVWWPEYKLLGLCGAAWPKEVTSLFKKHVYFQNSCDQDYAFSEWKGLGRPFDEIVSVCRDGLEADALSFLKMGRYNPEDFDPTADGEEFDDYYRRWAAYNGIFETLHLNQWLWGQEDDKFVRFSVTPLNCSERTFQAEQILRAYVEQHKDDIW